MGDYCSGSVVSDCAKNRMPYDKGNSYLDNKNYDTEENYAENSR